MRKSLVLGFVVVLALTCVSTAPALARSSTRDLVSVSAKNRDGTLRCTVSLSTQVDPGATLSATFTVKNISKSVQSFGVAIPGGTFTVMDAGNNVLPLPGLPSSGFGDVALPPGKSISLSPMKVVVRWPGPLFVKPGCQADGGRFHLPAVQVNVSSSPPAPDAQTALDSTLAVTGGLFDLCSPTSDGNPIVGTVAPSTWSGPGLDAACRAEISSYPSFVVVDLYFESPSLAPIEEVPIGTFPTPPAPGTSEIADYSYVVTQSAVTPFSTAMAYRTVSGPAHSPLYDYLEGTWMKEHADRCGDRGGAFGAGGITLVMIGACPPS